MRSRCLLPLLAAFLLSSSLPSFAQTIQISQQNKTIAINTTDEATSIADIAEITIGFQIFKPDAETATIEAGKLSHNIIDSLSKAGVEEKQIESRSQSVYRNGLFDQKEDSAQRAARLFQAEQSWMVRVAAKDAAATLHLAQAAGANQSGSIQWQYSHRKELQAEAAGNALMKARAVAAQMSEGLHVKLGALIYASNEAPDVHINFPQPKARSQGFNMAGGAMGSITGAIMNTPPLEIRPETIREEATVYAVFAIE